MNTAAVALTLDTHPPQVEVVADEVVTPPDDWTVTLTANEPISEALLTFVEPSGLTRALGYRRIDPMTLEVIIPTTEIPGGEGLLQGLVFDQACNVSTVLVPIHIFRDIPFDVSMTISSPWNVNNTLDHSWDVFLTLVPTLSVEIVIKYPWEVNMVVTKPFTIDWGMSVSG